MFDRFAVKLRGALKLRTKFFPLAIMVLACSQMAAETLSEPPSTLVVVISGRGSDASAEQISNKAARGSGSSGMYQLMGDLTKLGFKTMFFNWNGTPAGQFTEKNAPGATAIVSAIRNAVSKDKIKHLIVVGHSWGGHTMLEVSQKLNTKPTLKIELAIGIDATSFGLGPQADRLSPNVCKLICFHTRNAFTWIPWKNDPRIEDLDLGDPAKGFMVKGQPNYAAAFDIQAHNAIEWDERVHAAVLRRIKKTVTLPGSRGMPEKNRQKTAAKAMP
jgi:pimeloyl-ACP methyl ester carboxylesterase